MKAKFTIKRTFASIIELELDDAFIVFNSPDNLENIMRHARKQYSSLVTAGKEPEIGDQIDFDIVPVCIECGTTLDNEFDLPCFFEGRMVCPLCYHHLSEYTEREEAFKEAGVNLDEVADVIRQKATVYNHDPDNHHARNILRCELNAISMLLDAMNVPIVWEESDNRFTAFTLNNKTYTV